MPAKRVLVSAAAAALLSAASAAPAAGALAIGACGAYGTSYGHDSSFAARRSALSRCGDGSCRIAETIRNECAAFAVERHDVCGARGWAYAPSRGEAEALALDHCRGYSARGCRVRAWVCDDRG